MSVQVQTGPYRLLGYDTQRHPLRAVVEAVLESGPLEQITAPEEPILTRASDQSLRWQRIFYARFDLAVRAHYLELIEGVIRPYFEEPIVFQTVPTFRVQLRNNLAVGEWHRDRDYGHADHELNFWLPLTDAWGSNSVWIEAQHTFIPAAVMFGQIAVFDGPGRLHGNVPNLTGQTRVSFDFRAYPRRLHQDREESSVNGTRRFVLGDYWSEAR
jgi:hypothetical protein